MKREKKNKKYIQEKIITKNKIGKNNIRTVFPFLIQVCKLEFHLNKTTHSTVRLKMIEPQSKSGNHGGLVMTVVFSLEKLAEWSQLEKLHRALSLLSFLL